MTEQLVAIVEVRCDDVPRPPIRDISMAMVSGGGGVMDNGLRLVGEGFGVTFTARNRGYVVADSTE